MDSSIGENYQISIYARVMLTGTCNIDSCEDMIHILEELKGALQLSI